MVKPSAIHRQIASGTLDPLYLLLGDDEFEKRELATEFEGAIGAELRAFNVERFHGGESSLGDVLAAAQTLPMMAPRRLVVVLSAERVLEPKRESAAATRDAEALAAYVRNPPSHATLVLVASKLDERRRLTKVLLSKSTVVRCGQLETVGDAERWIRAQLKAENRQMSSDAVRGLAERSGPDIMRLRFELERLLLFVSAPSEVTTKDVQDVAGPPAPHDDWAVARAIERRAADMALRELGLVLESGAAAFLVLGQLAWIARTKLPAAQTRSAIEAVFRTDRALKRSAGNPRVLLERLVIELCQPARAAAAELRRR